MIITSCLKYECCPLLLSIPPLRLEIKISKLTTSPLPSPSVTATATPRNTSLIPSPESSPLPPQEQESLSVCLAFVKATCYSCLREADYRRRIDQIGNLITVYLFSCLIFLQTINQINYDNSSNSTISKEAQKLQ